jgi:outer membrane lipoprotein-sorting protein
MTGAPRLAVVAAMAWAAVQPLAPGGASDAGSAVLKRVSQAYDGIKSMQAAITRQTSYGQLGLTDPIETGVLAMKRRGIRNFLVRIEMREPAPRIFLVKGRRFLLFQPRLRQAIEGELDREDGDQAPELVLVSLLLGGVPRVLREYEVAALGPETLGDVRTSRLRLTPRATGPGSVRRLDLWVDDELSLVRRQEITTANESVTRLDFQDIRRNVDLPDSLFDLTLPPGVERLVR